MRRRLVPYLVHNDSSAILKSVSLSLSLSPPLCVCVCMYVCVDYIALIHSIRPLQAKQLSNTGDVPFTTTLETIVK